VPARDLWILANDQLITKVQGPTGAQTKMRFGKLKFGHCLDISAWTLVIRSASLALAVLVLGCASGCTRSAPQSERTVATRVLAEYVAKAAQPKAVLVMSNPFSEQSGRPAEVYAFEKAGIEGLKEGFGPKVPVTVAFPKLKDEVLRDPASVSVDPQTTTPLSFLVAPNAFSEVIQQNAKCDVVVSLIGLPINLAGMKEWSQPGAPKFALLLPDWRMIGGRDEILRVFREKKLLAAVVNKPNGAEGQGKDYKERFESRFFLVTEANVEGLLRDYPAVFGIR
jgi:hypothetical protein